MATPPDHIVSGLQCLFIHEHALSAHELSISECLHLCMSVQVTFNMTELMEEPEPGQPEVSVLQMLCCDWSGYFTLFRETPDHSQNPKKRYQKEGFLTFARMKEKMYLPDIFGTITELEKYDEAYTDV